MTDLEAKKIKLNITRAKACIEEYDYKIAEAEADIQRIKDQIELQKKIIVDNEAKLINN